MPAAESSLWQTPKLRIVFNDDSSVLATCEMIYCFLPITFEFDTGVRSSLKEIYFYNFLRLALLFWLGQISNLVILLLLRVTSSVRDTCTFDFLYLWGTWFLTMLSFLATSYSQQLCSIYDSELTELRFTACFWALYLFILDGFFLRVVGY